MAKIALTREEMEARITRNYPMYDNDGNPVRKRIMAETIECPECFETAEREKVGSLFTCDVCGQEWDVTEPSNDYAGAPEPESETLEYWLLFAGGADALDGCWVEPDGTCCHGYPAWPRHLGMV